MNQSDNIKKVFLLGGRDLEMMTIKRILEENDFYVVDKGLDWSDAKLCRYKKELERYSSDRYLIYGIELQEEDVDRLPENYVRIDHHNELQDGPSALEQVAEIIGHQLTEEEQLIAENDKGYYPGMEKFLSEKYPEMSIEERRARMDDIRRKDRMAQGVDMKEDEKACRAISLLLRDEAQGVDTKAKEKEIVISLHRQGDYTLIITDLKNFSPICDAMWPYVKLLVCRPVEGEVSLCYYGKDAQQSLAEFVNKYPDMDTYSGGGPDGYWGISDKEIPLDKLFEIVTGYVPIDISEFTKYVQSRHIFFFPFSWDWKGVEPEDGLKTLNSVSYAKWQKGKAKDNKELGGLFNELNYFFPFIHKELDEYTDEMSGMLASVLSTDEVNEWKENPRMLHFESKASDLKYEIVVKVEENDEPKWRKYSLDIDAVNLNFYSTGVGLLSIYTKNKSGYCQQTKDKNDWTFADKRIIDRDDVLKINQFGRRVMPPFYEDLKNRSEIAESIRIVGTGIDLYDDFTDFEKKENEIIRPMSWKCSKVIEGLLCDFKERIRYEIVIDDRMFVMAWYKNATCLSWAKEDLDMCVTGSYVENNGNNYWYRYLFVDNNFATCQNRHMRQGLMKEHSYVRWTDWSSLYGVTRYSFVYLTNAGVPKYLLDYFESMYARMVELVLMQRATVLKFSERINLISILDNGKCENSELIQNKVNSLCHDYIVFKNQFYFNEITAQDQGIEIYDMLQNSLRLEEMVKDLDDDIQEIYQYHSIIEEQEGNKKAQTLNIVMSFFTPASCLAALLTLGSWRETWTDSWDPWYLTGLGVALAVVISTALGCWINWAWVKSWWCKKHRCRKLNAKNKSN